MTAVLPEAFDRFRREYAAHRAAEGRAYSGAELLSLPYLRVGPLARQWAVRARTFDAFLARIVRPMVTQRGRMLHILDLGAGNGWLSHWLAREGHFCAAIDVRNDSIDGLGAAKQFPREFAFECILASFDDLPIADSSADLAVFNASLHYATDLSRTLTEAARVLRSGGLVAILDSPFYGSEEEGAAMVADKHRLAHETFGVRAEALLALPFIEFLTRDRLVEASRGLSICWKRLRVRYPLWYELRGIEAWLKGRRKPSRFDIWTGVVR